MKIVARNQGNVRKLKRVIDAADSPFWPFNTRGKYCDIQDFWRTRHLDNHPDDADVINKNGETFIWTTLITLDREEAEILMRELKEWLAKEV